MEPPAIQFSKRVRSLAWAIFFLGSGYLIACIQHAFINPPIWKPNGIQHLSVDAAGQVDRPLVSQGQIRVSQIVQEHSVPTCSDVLSWREKAREKDPHKWVASLKQLIKDSERWELSKKFGIFLEFLSRQEMELDADSFANCVKLALETMPELSKTTWDLSGNKLDAELGERLYRTYKKAGRADELFLSLSSAEKAVDEKYTSKMLTVLCDETKRMEQWSTKEIVDQHVKSEVEVRLFEDWLGEKKTASARKFLDPTWNVGDEHIAVVKLFSTDWFDNNALEISSLIRDAPTSSRRNALLGKMVERLRSTDPAAALAWASEIRN